jgi:hypothetical protein
VLPEGAADDDLADRQAVDAVVRDALARLPRQQRAVLVLRYCEDLPKPRWRNCSVARSARSRRTRTGGCALRERLGSEFDRCAVNETRAPKRDSG